MATTGADLKRILEAKYDKTYSSYLSSIKQNDLFKEALFATILSVYDELSDQESYDDISSLIKTSAVFKLNNNKIYTASIPISNVVFAFGNVIISSPVSHNLIAGDFITIEGVSGIISNPVINGTFTVTSFLNNATQFSIASTYTSGTYVANTGQVSHVDDGGSTNVNKMVDDYWALLALKAKYEQTLQFTITSATNLTPIRIGVNKRNNIKTGEVINISGVNGNSNANGDRYVKKINTYQYDLYSDKDLTIPIGGNGIFAGVGTIKRIHYKSATPYYSSRQISEYSKPSITSPQFDRADNQIKILPNDSVCSELTLDYITVPPIEIDVANTTLDLDNYFHYDFLIMVCDKAKEMFFLRSKDFESVQGEVISQQITK